MFRKKLWGTLILGVLLGTFCGLLIPLNAEKSQAPASKISDDVWVKKVQAVKENLPVPPEKENEMDLPSAVENTVQENTRSKEKTIVEHKNRTLNNINMAFFGVENGQLQMLTVYSINRENGWKSGTVFVPTDSLVPGTGGISFAEYFKRNGTGPIKKILAENMEIEIAYYVKVDRNLLLEVESCMEPIYLEGEKINLAELFTREITPADEVILASLLKKFTSPSVYFGLLPELVWTCKQYIETDFAYTWKNLWVHYQIAKNIDTTKVRKKVLPGRYKKIAGKRFFVPDQAAWWNTIYEVTQ